MTKLKEILESKGITQKWLADRVGTTEAAMCRYVKGDRVPKAPLAIAMARALGVDVEELYPGDPDPYAGFESYRAEPIVGTPLLQSIDNPTLIAWFRCNSCYTCLWRKNVLDNDPDRDISWCSKTHDRVNIVDMVRYLGYSKE